MRASKFVALHCVLLHLQFAFAEDECKCKIEIPEKIEGEKEVIDRDILIPEYLRLLAEKEKQEEGEETKCCKNYADIFSDWAPKLCPKSIAEVAEESKSTNKAEGGKSGQDVLLTKRFVIKQAAPHEIESIDYILAYNTKKAKEAKEKGEKLGPSLLAPICRKLIVEDKGDEDEPTEKVFTVAPLIGIKDAKMFPDEVKFDLKGNCKYKNRKAPAHSSTQKDVNFREKFPGGLFIENKTKRDLFKDALINDAKMLKENGLMDYSILLHAVETCPYINRDCDSVYHINVDPLKGRRLSYEVQQVKKDEEGKAKEIGGGKYEMETVEKEFKFGSFRRACADLSEQAGLHRPLYSNGKKEFLYFYEKAWRIGPNISAADEYVFSEANDRCPSLNIPWRTRNKEGKAIKVVMGLTSTREQVAMDQAGIIKNNKAIEDNLAFAISPASGKTYAISYVLIDLFLHQERKGNWKTHAKNQAGTRYACSGNPVGDADCCGQNMPDPLDALQYHSRLLMMIGHRTGEECLDRGGGYWTYFPSVGKSQASKCELEKYHVKNYPCKTLCDHLELSFDKKNNKCTEFETNFNKCRGWLHGISVGVDAVASSQAAIEDWMVKPVFKDDVMVAIDEITRNIEAQKEKDRIEGTKKEEKYRSCHDKLKKSFDKYENEGNARAYAVLKEEKAESITVAGCSKAARGNAIVMASLMGVHDRVELGSIEIVASADSFFHRPDGGNLAAHPKVIDKGLSETCVAGLSTLLLKELEENQTMFYAINMPGDVPGKVDDTVKKALGFRSKSLPNCSGWWKIYVADFTVFNDPKTSREHLEHTPYEIEAFLYTQLDRAMAMMMEESSACPDDDKPSGGTVPASGEASAGADEAASEVATDEKPDDPSVASADEKPDDPSVASADEKPDDPSVASVEEETPEDASTATVDETPDDVSTADSSSTGEAPASEEL